MKEIAKAYEPKAVEERWYSQWTSAGCFKPSRDLADDAYCVVIPPPNVTGVLTMGHVLNNTIQDILVRRARQQGKSTLWLPGTDHAGIATQTKVERKLKAEGKSKYDLGRESFLECAKEWRDTHGGIIIEQLKRLGASCDWDRLVHTLDDDYSHAVIKAFVDLYDKGYIYRGKRMVNWCPVSHTALSDEEVIMKPQQGLLYKVRYELVDAPGQYLEVSTTRPETIMGDTAVAVNPEDPRYKQLIGQKVWRPIPREEIPIVGDSAVEMDFGTGVLKVTPAHDPVDFDIGQRHDLPTIDIMNPDGTLNEFAGESFKGMDRFVARKEVAKTLDSLGLLIEEESYENNVGFSERADVPVEPRLSEQWFLKYPKVEEAKEVVQGGLIKFWPQRWEKTYLHWLENIQDWCISRQLWWGHRIPVWYKKGEDRTNPDNWHVSVSGPSDPENWEQDDDVLDTWASSWLWPFATLGWPDPESMKESGFRQFYPTSDLVTGPDIIFFWVARMIMAGLEFMDGDSLKDRIPFSNVYFTGIVRDMQGRKMSKSLGNSPDPIDLIDKYGADGLRFSIMNIAPQGQDIPFAEERVQHGRHFCNKIWNACRFRLMSGDLEDNTTLEAIVKRIDISVFDADDHAILARLIEAINSVNQALDTYEFSAATHHIYNFFWGDFCDWYVEVSKTKLQDESLKSNCLAIQDLVIRQTLLMLHPFMPFITEELWHELSYGQEDEFIQNMPLEVFPIALSKDAVKEVNEIREFVTKVRALKASFNLASKRDVKVFLQVSEGGESIIKNNIEKILKAIGAQSLDFVTEPVSGAPASVTTLGTAYLDLSQSLDIDKEIKRLTAELEKLQKHVTAGESKLKNQNFVSNAPPAVVEGAKKQLQEAQQKYDEVKRLLSVFQSV